MTFDTLWTSHTSGFTTAVYDPGLSRARNSEWRSRTNHTLVIRLEPYTREDAKVRGANKVKIVRIQSC